MDIITQNTALEQCRKNKNENPQNVSVGFSPNTILTNKSDVEEFIRATVERILSENSSDAVLTLPESAQFLKVSLPTMRLLVSTGKVKSFRHGQVIRVYRKDLMNLASENSRMKGVS